MRFGLTEDQIAVRDTVREVLADTCPPSVVRAAWSAPDTAVDRVADALVELGVPATAAMFWIGRGDYRLAEVLFVLGNIGVYASYVFYDSLLPHVASDDEMDRVSSAGYAIGYLGGGLLLVLNLLWSLVFFGRRAIGPAFVEILVLWLAIAGTIQSFSRERTAAGVLLVPYLGWTTFATILNGSIWYLNRDR